MAHRAARHPGFAPVPWTEAAASFVLPSDDTWDEARQAWNLALDLRPAAVAFPASAQEAVEIVRFARRNGLRIAAQGTGHGSSPLGSLEDTILVKPSRMKDVQIYPEARLARAEAGTVWQDVTEPAAEHGLAALAGSSPDVGVVGYTLGGGLSWLSRRYGMACQSLRAAELVTADGSLVRTDSQHNPDLFWALRGAGGSFGLVTALEFALYPVERLYAGALFWPMERAGEVLRAWREWAMDLPHEMNSVGRLLRPPPLPEVPEPVRGREFVVVEAAYIGDERSGRELLSPLRELAPEMDTFAMIPAPALAGLHMDPPQPVPFAGDGMLLDDLPEPVIDELVTAEGANSGSPLLSVEFRTLGAAVAGAREFPAPIDAPFAMYTVGMTMDADAKAAAEARIQLIKSTLSPSDSGRSYANFTERRVDGEILFGPENHGRLREIKGRYDSEDLFLANHPIAPAD